MPSDYDWTLPSFEDTGGSNQYDLTSTGGSSGVGNASQYSLTDTSTGSGNFSFNDPDWYVNSTGSDPAASGSTSSIFSDIWSWVKSPQGVSMLGGAATEAYKLWAAKKAAELAKQNDDPTAAELYDARVRKHNESINAPVNMGMIKLQAP